jgi:excisionase family DNA binding protein
MPLTLAQAAQATGLNRSTILRAIKSGRISGTRDDLGAWAVEPVELHRIFPPAEVEPKAVQQVAQPDTELHIRLALAEEKLGDLKVQLEDMRSQRDKWQTQAERLAALPAPAATAPPRPLSWWAWLRSTG